jgi:fibronectin type 3 domain-containing protein
MFLLTNFKFSWHNEVQFSPTTVPSSANNEAIQFRAANEHEVSLSQAAVRVTEHGHERANSMGNNTRNELRCAVADADALRSHPEAVSVQRSS